MQFADFFSDEQIIRHLCKLRIKRATTHSVQQDIARFLGNPLDEPERKFINTLLPPRRTLAAFRPFNRGRIADVNLASLCEATMVLRQSQPDLPWAVNLSRFIEGIRHRVFSDRAFTFHAPRINWVQKEGHKYRALCIFPREDNIINSLLARYLRDFCDPAFDRSSYAFRGPGEKGRTPTHHHAFDEIYRLKSAQPKRDL